MSKEKIVTVANFEDEIAAHFAKLKLDQAGIPNFIADANIVSTYWLYSNAINGVKLKVRQSDIQRAIEILSENEDIEPEDALEQTDFKCPRCGSEDIDPAGIAKDWAYIFILFFRFPIFVRKKTNLCNACGYIWKKDKKTDRGVDA